MLGSSDDAPSRPRLLRKIRAGIIGTGFAASCHVDALLRVGVELGVVAGSSREKAESFAAAKGIARACGDPLYLIDDDSIEVVHNCTPNHLHAEINKAALDSGKHLLSEKPLGMNSEETASLVHAAAQSDVVSGVCFIYRHYPLVRQVKSLIDGGDVGVPHLVHGNYLQDWLLRETDWNWRLDSGKGGASRAVADIGSHWLDLVQYVTGDHVVEVFAELGTLHARRLRPEGGRHTFAANGEPHGAMTEVDTEDSGAALLRFASGARGVFHVSQVSAGHKNRLFFEIDAAQGSLAWDQEQPNRLWMGRRDDANSELLRDPALLSDEAAPLAHLPGGHTEGWHDALKNLFSDFYAAVAAHQRSESYAGDFATFSDAHRVMLEVEAIVKSHRGGLWTKVDEAEVQE